MTTPSDPRAGDVGLPPPEPREEHALDVATGDAMSQAAGDAWTPITPEERAAAAVHLATAPMHRLPDGVRSQLLKAARDFRPEPSRVESPRMNSSPASPIRASTPSGPRRVLPWLLAACVGGLITGVIVANRVNAHRAREIEAIRSQAERSQIQAEELRKALEEANAVHAQRLTALTRELDEAKLTIARFEAPEDPAVLAANRTKLLEVPDTIRVAWQPFDLPEKPAELKNITGDVVWNDKLQTGYLRFVGLKVNDPAIEQYQVWVIDERGMEQKVSGGIFNATAQGEVIVPIEPGIDVGRVALFAITIEKPGGTWVPDLQRRVVVAPRG